MAQDYPLEELSPRAFEQLTVALSLAVLGPGVEAFGSGPDGGREATFRGKVRWSEASDEANEWNGYTVVQAKQREHLVVDTQNNLRWLLRQIDAELETWLLSESRYSRFPNYLLFATNVRVSSVPDAGVDRLNAHLTNWLDKSIVGASNRTLRKLGLREIKVWHRDQINGLLTKHGSIRNSFKALLTVGDLLQRLGQFGGIFDPDHFHPVLHAHASNALATERWVSFQEAGGSTRESVEQIVIDLKLKDEGGRESTVLSEIFARSAAVLKSSMGDREIRPHVVLTGRAGSGKSTITKFLTQAFRADFATDERLPTTASEVRSATQSVLDTIAPVRTKGRRWPMLVRLTDYADAVGPSGDLSLLRFIADRVSDRAEIDVKPIDIKRWITYWPSVLILDGLDEVTAAEVRLRVLDEITQFVEEMEEVDADVLIIVTTRPTGDSERILPERFQQLALQVLDIETAERYGRIVTNRRLSDDHDRRAALLRAFERQLRERTMQRLMKTPLQVLIMTIILERVGTLPTDRYQLYSQYFDTVYTRESGKSTTLAPLLSSQNKAIVYLHETVGQVLHEKAETSEGARSVLPRTELRRLLDERLIELGHDVDHQRTQIGDRIMQAATERLVLLIPDEEDGYAFEVRSLQELMAARSLVRTTDETLRQRLIALAPSPHWRATWVFMAGYIFSNGNDAQRDLVVQIVETFDVGESWPGWLSPIGPDLAAALLDDGLAVQTPKWHRRLVQVALRCISGPPPNDMIALADGLSAAASVDESTRTLIRNRLKQSLSGNAQASFVGRLLLEMTGLGRGLDQSVLNSGTEPVGNDGPKDLISIGRVLRTQLSVIPVGLADEAISRRLLSDLDTWRVGVFGSSEIGVVRGAADGASDARLADCIDSTEGSALLELLLTSLSSEQWRVAHGVGLIYLGTASRRPVSGLLHRVGATEAT